MFIITIPCDRAITSVKFHSNEGNIPVSCAPIVTPEYCNATETKLGAEVLKKKVLTVHFPLTGSLMR